MNFRLGLFLLTLFLASLITPVPLQHATVQAETHIIRVPEDYSSIQEAINAAENGSILLVTKGVYHETVILNKTLTLMGINEGCVIENAAVYGDPKDPHVQWTKGQESVGLDVIADNSTIIGITIRNCTLGIRLNHCNGSTVNRNNLTLNIHALMLDNSNGSFISDNSVCSNLLEGIELNNSYDNTISKNIVSSTSAIELDGSIGFGLHLSSSSTNKIMDNILTDSAWDDILLEANSNNNTFSRNTIGPMYYYGPKITEDSCANNTFFLNNIISIVPPFTPYSPWTLSRDDFWSFQGEGNYWADYSGLDNGNDSRIMGDHIGDTELPWHGVDDYPLISPVNPIPVLWNSEVYHVVLSTNNTICSGAAKDYGFIQYVRSFKFMALGPLNTTGYFDLTLPKSLLSGPWSLYMSGVPTYARVTFENETYTTISMSYENIGYFVNLIGTHVIPEYPAVDAGFLFMLVSAVALAIGKKELKKFKQPKNTRPLSARQTKTKPQNLTLTLRTKYLHGTSLNGRPNEHSSLRHDGQ
jgi:parallel beta-helix repeat protein